MKQGVLLFVFFVYLNDIYCIRNHQSDLITSDAIAQSNSISSLSGASNSLSVSASEANNVKVLQTTVDDYAALSQYQDGFLPIIGGPTFVDQIYTQEQLSSLNNGIDIVNQISFSNDNTNIILDVISPIILGQCIEVKWKMLDLLANDIGIGPQGDIYAAGVDGRVYYYSFLKNKWIGVSGDFDLGSIMKVAVGTDGTPYIVTTSGSTYFLNVHNEWIKLPGCATDISIGRGGEVFKIGCDIRSNGFGIYKLMSNQKEEIKSKKNCRCLRQRGFCPECSYNYFSKEEDDFLDRYWFRLSGSGVKVAVSPFGNPYVVTSNGMIMVYDDSKWKPILTTGNARDISISNDGELFYLDNYSNIFRLIDKKGNVFQLCGVGKAISVGPFSQPVVIGVDKRVYTSSKYNFN